MKELLYIIATLDPTYFFLLARFVECIIISQAPGGAKSLLAVAGREQELALYRYQPMSSSRFNVFQWSLLAWPRSNLEGGTHSHSPEAKSRNDGLVDSSSSYCESNTCSLDLCTRSGGCGIAAVSVFRYENKRAVVFSPRAGATTKKIYSLLGEVV